LIVSGDKRELIQNAVDYGNISVTSSPWIIITFWDGSHQEYLGWWWYESGAIVHNVLLEAAALNLGGNVLSVITDQNGLRAALGLSGQPNLVAMHLALVGHMNGGGQNNPPLAPNITGPSDGLNGVQYNYTVVTTDPDGDDVYYFIDWGDGTSGWYGPYPSGMMVTINHTWSNPGTYTIQVKAKDSNGSESDWTFYEVTIAGPRLEIEIKGGMGIKVTIKNTGTAAATNITGEIVLTEGFIIPAQKTIEISNILMGEQSTIHMGMVGLGKMAIKVTLTADDGITAEKTASGFLFLFLAIGVK